jgi:hypothetical protein
MQNAKFKMQKEAAKQVYLRFCILHFAFCILHFALPNSEFSILNSEF